MATITQIRSKMKSFTTSRDALRSQGHEILMDIIRHVAPKEAAEDCGGSGKTDLALEMLNLMPTSWAEQAVAWLAFYTPITVNVRNGVSGYTNAYKKLSSEEKLTKWDIAGASAKPFWEFQKERPVRADLDFDGFIESIQKMVTKALNVIDKRDENGGVKEEEVENIAAAARRLKSLDFSDLRPKAPANTNEDSPVLEEAAA